MRPSASACITVALGLLTNPALAQGFSCNPVGNQQELNECAMQDYDRVDHELNELYHQKVASLTSPEKERLKAAQKAWLDYRDKSCLYEAMLREESGSIWPLEHFRCMERLTKQRVEILKAYVACTENGCPV